MRLPFLAGGRRFEPCRARLSGHISPVPATVVGLSPIVAMLRTLGGRMSKLSAVLGSALFFVVAPAMLAGIIPWLITQWEFRPPLLDAQATRLAGLAFVI